MEIDTAKKGEVSRADFLKYRMKSFEELDVNKDGKLSLDEFLKVAEPPMSADVPGGPTSRSAATARKAEFQNLDTNRDGFIERAEAEALVHSEFNQYDTDRDNKVTEPEVRLIVQRSMRARGRRAPGGRPAPPPGHGGDQRLHRHAAARGRPARQEQRRQDQPAGISRAGRAGRRPAGQGPAALRHPQAARAAQVRRDRRQQGRPARPRRADRLAVRQFLEIDTNKDRFLTEDEFKKAQENETKKMRAIIQAMQPAQPAQPRPAPPRTAARRPAQRRRSRRAWRRACRRERGSRATPRASSASRMTRVEWRVSSYSTVTLLARLRGWSTSVPLATAV